LIFKSLIRLTKHSAIYGMGHILSRSIGFFLLPLYTNHIPPNEYAIYIYGYAFIPFIAILYSAGINFAQLRYYILAKTEQEKSRIFFTSFYSTLVVSLIFSVLFLFLSKQISVLVFGDANYGYLVKISCGILLSDALALLMFNVLRAEEKSFQFVAFNLFTVIITIVFNILFIVVYKKGIDGIFIANLIASTATLALLLILTKSHFKGAFSYPLLKELFKFGLPLIPSSISVVILTVIDRFIIRKLMGDESVGIYGAGYKMGMIMSLLITAFRYAWHPFYLSIAQDDKDAKEIFSKVLTYFIFICCAIFLSISLFIDEIVRFQIFGLTIFGKEYWQSTVIVPAILGSYIFYGVYLNLQTAVYLENKTQYLFYLTGLSAIINIVANFLFIPHLGLLGAAYATLIAYVFMTVAIYFYTNKLYPVQYEWLRISKLSVLCLLLYIIGKYSYPHKPSVFKLIFIAAYFFILYFVGFYEKKEISRIKIFLKQIVAKLS